MQPTVDTAAPGDDLQAWLGRQVRQSDSFAAAPLAGLAATLDHADCAAPVPGSAVPALAHWLYFLPQVAQGELGADGHAKRGGFLPPVPLPRRMWAGGRLQFHHDLLVGNEAERRSIITRVDAKQGRSGALVFVTVRHEVSDARGVALVEEQDIVYRGHPVAGLPAPAPAMARTDEQFGREITPDPVLLFRYSALTFNGHRIHYDRSYVTAVEGYPGLVVHGPLIATLLVDLLRREQPNLLLKRFDFMAASPLFDIHPFTVCGRAEADGRVALWARNHLGQLAMSATATLA